MVPVFRRLIARGSLFVNRLSYVAIALIVAGGFSVMGFFIGDGLRNIRSTDRYVNVRGLSEREVAADTAKLFIHVEHTGSAPAAIFPIIAETQKRVLAFLAQEGIKDDEIETGQWTTTRTSAQDLKDDPSRPRYSVSSVINVMTRNIGATQSAYRKINDLRIQTNGGVTESDVAYSFTGVAQLRAEMIAAATKDARNAAVQFAADSGSKVGSIRNASQGVFQITVPGQDSDDVRSVRKNVRVVTTVDYELKD
jgi:hypothetical protein